MKTDTPDIRPFTHQFYRGNRGRLTLGLVAVFLSTGSNLVISWLLQQILDLISGASTPFTLPQLALLTGGAVALVALAAGCEYASQPRFRARAMAQYKTYAYERLSQKGIAAFSGENTALYLSALSNDAAVIESDYVQSLFEIFQQALLFVAALAMMFFYDPLLTGLSILLSLVPILVSVSMGNRMAVAEKAVSDRNETYISTLKDSLSGFSVIKSFRAEARMCQIFAQEVRQVSKAREKSQKILIVVSACSMIANAAVQLGVLLVGAWLALSGRGITAGTVLVFVQLMNYVLGPISALPTMLAKRKAAAALIRKLAQALEENIREDGAAVQHTLNQGITLENLSFSYDGENQILHNISCHFRPGGRYAIVGASGSGKSTLLNLLMASRNDYTGSICYDGTELRQINRESLYALVAQIQQNVFIFNASIRDNITMFADFPQEDVRRAIQLSGLAPLIAQKGEAYLCGENGSALSGGEKQRISIARSLLQNSRVLLVDEATAALDAETAHQVSSAILHLKDVTSIVVTHTLEETLLRQYDGIFTLKNGAIVESGTFQELIDKKGYFYSLFTISQ